MHAGCLALYRMRLIATGVGVASFSTRRTAGKFRVSSCGELWLSLRFRVSSAGGVLILDALGI